MCEVIKTREKVLCLAAHIFGIFKMTKTWNVSYNVRKENIYGELMSNLKLLCPGYTFLFVQ